MLNINGQKYQIISSEIRYVNATYNKVEGYSILVELNFEINNIKGYVAFYVDFFDNNNFKNIENRVYEELPTELDSKIDSIEIFDTNNFIDFIDSVVTLQFGNIIDDKIKMELHIDDELIKLEYNGLINIKTFDY